MNETAEPMARCLKCAFVGIVLLDPPRMMSLFGYKGTLDDWLTEHGFMMASRMDGAIECPKCGGYDVEGNGCTAMINAKQSWRR